jgi:exopolysaccharide production protein ExoQ
VPFGSRGDTRGGSLRRMQVVVAAVALMILTNGPSFRLSHHYGVPLGWERWPYLLPMGAVALCGVYLCGRDVAGSDLRRFRIPLAAIVAYSAWSGISVLWSVAPDATAARALVTVGVSCLGWWFGTALRFREQVFSLFLAMGSLTLVSFVLIVVRPGEYQIPAPTWHPSWMTTAVGIFGNPNSLGPVAALAVLTSIVLWFLYTSWILRCCFTIIAMIGLLLTVWSQCVTALVFLAAAGAVAGVIALLPVLRRASGWLVASAGVLLAFLAWRLFFDHIGRIASWVGEDPNLSSRRTIWHDVRLAISERPWRGYGFFAFWDNASLTADTYARVGKAYGSAHNSILEVALGLGRIGLLPYLVLIAVMLYACTRNVWRRTDIVTVTWTLFTLFIVVQNSMESFVLWHSYVWALFVAASVAPLIDVPRPRTRPDGQSRLDELETTDLELLAPEVPAPASDAIPTTATPQTSIDESAATVPDA